MKDPVASSDRRRKYRREIQRALDLGAPPHLIFEAVANLARAGEDWDLTDLHYAVMQHVPAKQAWENSVEEERAITRLISSVDPAPAPPVLDRSHWTEQDLQEERQRVERADIIQQLWADGWSYAQIGAAVFRSRSALTRDLQWMRRHGYSLPYRKTKVLAA